MLILECQGERVEDLFFFLHGPGRHKGLMAVFFGFLDGSNTHSGAKVWTLCGFIGDETAFQKLDSAWNQVLNKPEWPTRLKRFHTVECVRRFGEFEHWEFADRLALWGELISVITSLPILALGSVVITEDFAKLDAEEMSLLQSEGLGDPLDLSVQHVFQRSISLTRNTCREESIRLLFDNEIPATVKRCTDFATLYKLKFGFDKWLSGVGFSSSYEFTPLQAADLLAYGTYQLTMLRYPEIRQPDFPVLPGFSRMITGVFNDGGGFDLESMKKLAAQIKARKDRNKAN